MRHAPYAAAIIALAMCAPNASAQQQHAVAQVVSPIDLAHRGDGYPVFRIPALAVTTRGTLIAAYDGRPTMADLPSHISLLARRSIDGGKSWLPRQVVRTDSAPAGFGDPSLLVDRSTGRIFLFHAASVRQGFFGSAIGNRDDDPEVLQADYSWSDDDGVTWQHRRITGMIKNPAWGGIFASSGAGIQLERGPHKGRLIQQYVVRYQGGNYGASAYSDDHGTSWRMGELVGPGIDENKTVELADGRLLLNSRARGMRKSAVSSDGGNTWQQLRDEPLLVDPGNNGSIVRYDVRAPASEAASHWLLFSNTEDATRRINLTVKMSCDDGRTWPIRHVVEPGPSAYSTLAILPDGAVGLLYERGDYDYLTFVRFSLDQLGGRCR